MDPSLQAEAPISFELPPSTTALPNLNKRRAPRQPKRLPARYNTANVLGSEPTSQEMNQKAGKQAPKKKGGNKWKSPTGERWFGNKVRNGSPQKDCSHFHGDFHNSLCTMDFFYWRIGLTLEAVFEVFHGMVNEGRERIGGWQSERLLYLCCTQK